VERRIDVLGKKSRGVTLSTLHDWHTLEGEFELQISITKVRRKLEQSLCTAKKRL
jgi:hypothetical protein